MAIIAHLDMDAFFAAVEERNNPQWAGKPIVVGSDPRSPAGEGQGRGVVSTANYAARKFGIRSALPISTAWKLAQAAKKRGEPATIFVQGFWRNYSNTSKRIVTLLPPLLLPLTKGETKAGVVLKQTGIDELYLDLSFAKTFPAAEAICQNIKQAIKKRERLTCSIGLGPNKLIAKIASDFKKPDGLTVVLPEDAKKFLEPLSIRAIPGIGPKAEIAFNARGIRTIRELKQLPREDIGRLYDKARGHGSSTLSADGPPKSISEQQTFERDTRNPVLLTKKLHEIAKNLIKYLNQKYSHILKYGSKPTFRTVTVTCRFSDFETHTFSHTLKKPTGSLDVLKIESLRLLLPFLDRRKNPGRKLIRLIGLRIEKLQ